MEESNPPIKINPFFNHSGDWFDVGKVEIREHSRFNRQIVAACTIVCGPEWEDNVAGYFTKTVSLQNSEQQSPIYLVSDGKGRIYDLEHTWIGLTNHSPPLLANMQTFDNCLYAIPNQVIRKSTPLTWDYGVDYWVFQLTGIDIAEYSPNEVLIFLEMHQRVVDYTELLEMDLSSQSKEAIPKLVKQYLDCFQIQYYPTFDNFIRTSTPRSSLNQNKNNTALSKKKSKRKRRNYFYFPIEQNHNHHLKIHQMQYQFAKLALLHNYYQNQIENSTIAEDTDSDEVMSVQDSCSSNLQ